MALGLTLIVLVVALVLHNMLAPLLGQPVKVSVAAGEVEHTVSLLIFNVGAVAGTFTVTVLVTVHPFVSV